AVERVGVRDRAQPQLQGVDAGSCAPLAERTASASAAGSRWRVLPHEIVFSVFLLITWARLVAGGAALTAAGLSFFLFLVASVVVVAWGQARPNPLRWRLRLLFYPALMGASFYMLTPAMAQLNVPRVDGLLNSWDLALLGTNLSVACQSFLAPWLTDVMMAGYLFYFIYLIGGPATYCIRDLPRFRLLFVGMFCI